MPDHPDHPTIRFEATVHAKGKNAAAEAVADLDLDRVPDTEGEVRVLVTAEDAARLLDRGCEVRLHKAHRVRPIDPSLVMDDEAARSWLDTQTRGIDRQGGR
jgi:hypothetical protein